MILTLSRHNHWNLPQSDDTNQFLGQRLTWGEIAKSLKCSKRIVGGGRLTLWNPQPYHHHIPPPVQNSSLPSFSFSIIFLLFQEQKTLGKWSMSSSYRKIAEALLFSHSQKTLSILWGPSPKQRWTYRYDTHSPSQQVLLCVGGKGKEWNLCCIPQSSSPDFLSVKHQPPSIIVVILRIGSLVDCGIELTKAQLTTQPTILAVLSMNPSRMKYMGNMQMTFRWDQILYLIFVKAIWIWPAGEGDWFLVVVNINKSTLSLPVSYAIAQWESHFRNPIVSVNVITAVR